MGEAPFQATELPCTFCGGKLVLGYDLNDEPMILHTTPFCTRFDAVETPNEMLDFLVENRRKLGIPDPPEPS